MYTPKAFQAPDFAAMCDLMQTYSFATIVTVANDECESSFPLASQMPVLFDEEHAVLRSHLARANPQCSHLAAGRSTLVIFHGPHAYISPTWYESEFNVPTWNYATVHAYGTPRLIDEPQNVQMVLDELVALYEMKRAQPWSVPWIDERYAKMTRGLVAFEIAIERLEGKFKLSQNKTRADQQSVALALDEQGDADSVDTAALMRAE